MITIITITTIAVIAWSLNHSYQKRITGQCLTELIKLEKLIYDVGKAEGDTGEINFAFDYTLHTASRSMKKINSLSYYSAVNQVKTLSHKTIIERNAHNRLAMLDKDYGQLYNDLFDQLTQFILKKHYLMWLLSDITGGDLRPNIKQKLLLTI